MEHTLALIEKAHEGDKAARDTLAEENMGLVWSMVRRFANRGVEMEDLCQIGSIGLLKAIDKFDPSFEVCFSTYAVPMIAGEIRRFLRSEGMVKVSRPIRELAWKAYAVRERLERENGRDPTLAEIAGELDVTVEEIVEAMVTILTCPYTYSILKWVFGNLIFKFRLENFLHQYESIGLF